MMKAVFEPPGVGVDTALRPKCDELPSSFACNLNLRRYVTGSMILYDRVAKRNKQGARRGDVDGGTGGQRGQRRQGDIAEGDSLRGGRAGVDSAKPSQVLMGRGDKSAAATVADD